MNTGGRRGPLGPRLRGLSCFALILAVLGLWLGAVVGASASTGGALPEISPSSAVVQVVARAHLPDLAAVPVELPALAVGLAAVLLVVRRPGRPLPVRVEARHGRAPPRGPGPS